MAHRFSLRAEYPPGFQPVYGFIKAYFCVQPFVLLVDSVEQARAFFAGQAALAPGLVLTIAEPPELEQGGQGPVPDGGAAPAPRGAPPRVQALGYPLYHLELTGVSQEQLEPLLAAQLLMLVELLKQGDERRLAELELSRAHHNMQRLAGEFDATRKGLLRELAERKASELRLRERDRIISGLLDSVFEFLSLLSPDGRLLQTNRSALEMLGIDEAEVLGAPLWNTPWFVTEQQRDQVRQAVQEAGQGRAAQFESVHTEPNGRMITVMVSMRPRFNEQGAVEFLVAEGWNITELREAEHEREQLHEKLMIAQKLESLGRLAGGVAHDFNNMLAVILGRTELLLHCWVHNDPHYEDLQSIRDAAERSAQLTRQLLTFARRQTVCPQHIELNQAVEATLKMLRRLVREELKLEFLPGLGKMDVLVDPSQLDQLLTNLVVNARDAIPGTGAIRLRTWTERRCAPPAEGHEQGGEERDYVVLSVSDTGEGMTEQTKARIFDPFFTTKELGRGTGLGLSTVLGIVLQHNGFIEVSSEVGKGTEFLTYLPYETRSSEELPCAPLSERKGRTHMRVLVVEDEPEVLSLTCEMLLRLGYQVFPERSARQALSKLSSGELDVDLLVTDLVMPELGGRELWLRCREFLPDLHCLYMSGYAADLGPELPSHHAEAPLLLKPFTMADLARKLDEASPADAPISRDFMRSWQGPGIQHS